MLPFGGFLGFISRLYDSQFNPVFFILTDEWKSGQKSTNLRKIMVASPHGVLLTKGCTSHPRYTRSYTKVHCEERVVVFQLNLLSNLSHSTQNHRTKHKKHLLSTPPTFFSRSSKNKNKNKNKVETNFTNFFKPPTFLHLGNDELTIKVNPPPTPPNTASFFFSSLRLAEN